SEKLETIERMTHRSSAQLATWGNKSLIGMPHWPCWRNFHGDWRTVPMLLNWVGCTFILIGWPCSFASRGFGSNVSTCEGPPSMNKKITLVALGWNCGGRGVKGLFSSRRTSPYADSPSNDVRASAPKPL